MEMKFQIVSHILIRFSFPYVHHFNLCVQIGLINALMQMVFDFTYIMLMMHSVIHYLRSTNSTDPTQFIQLSCLLSSIDIMGLCMFSGHKDGKVYEGGDSSNSYMS